MLSMRAARRAAPASPYSRNRLLESRINIADVSFAFPSAKRLDQAGVLAVLKRGKRLNRTDFELRVLNVPVGAAAGESKIAISVPKRLLKSSVARNRIKRLVREEFRVHRVAAAPLHMLVNYKAKNDGRDGLVRRNLRAELATLFDDAAIRMRAVPVNNVHARTG